MGMIDREKVIKGLQIERECVSRNCDRDCGNCDLVQDRDWLLSVYDDAIALLKEQEEQKRKWLQTIADTQLAVSPTGYETEEGFAKRTGEWNGLQMAWEIIAGEERSERPRLVRCKDCRHHRKDTCSAVAGMAFPPPDDWFCADGKRKDEVNE